MAPRLELATFGRLALLCDGAAIGGAAGQRRPLAVLAILADAGDAGISRDKITALIWPDSEPDRARKALAQTLYSVRRAAGSEDLFVGVGDLRLNRQVIAVDTADFIESIKANDLEKSAEIYRGAFCDGFVVQGAPELERWLDSRRGYYSTQAQSALKKLSSRAREESSVAAEIEWSRRLVALDVHDPAPVAALMDSLEKSGDIAGAIRAGEAHEKVMRDDLELAPSATVTERLARLNIVARSSGKTAAPRRKTPDSNRRMDRSADLPIAAEDPVETRSGINVIHPRIRAIVSAGAILSAVVIAVVMIVALLRRQEPTPAVAATPPVRPDVVAILPFAVHSADASLSFLGEGAADLISRWLSAWDRPRAVDPGAVLAVLDTLHAPSDRSAPAVIEHARQVARQLGAGEVMVGRIAGTAAALSVSATIYDVASGDERASTQISGKADSLSSLFETVATRLVAQNVVGPERANAFADAKFKVLRSYLRAESAFHDDNYRTAVELYEQALAEDSTFAPAALGLAIAADRRNAGEQHERGLALAWAARDKLGGRDRAYLDALAGPRYPEPSIVGDQIAAWEKVVALTPDRATTWTELGERFLFDGGFLGIRNAQDRAQAAFTRSLQLDRDNSRALRGLLQLAARNNDVRSINNLLGRKNIGAIGGEIAGYIRWRVAIARKDTADLRRIRARFPSLSEPSLRSIAMSSQHEAIATQDGERALKLLSSSAVLAAEQLDVLLAQHSAALNAGKPIKALDITEQLQDAQPGSRAHLRLRVLDAIYSDGDTAAAKRAVIELKSALAQPARDETSRALRAADMCVLAQWYAAPWRNHDVDSRSGDEVRGMIRDLRAMRNALRTIPVAAGPRSL